MPATAESNLLNINLDEIIETERILLPVGKSFDAERRRFIKNFETIDLQAVNKYRSEILNERLEQSFENKSFKSKIIISNSNVNSVDRNGTVFSAGSCEYNSGYIK